jgi:taurine dioxygenase
MTTMDVRPISPVIGAEVDAGDVRKLDEAARAELRELVVRHQVIFLRDQDLSDDEHLEVMSWFGEPVNSGEGLVGELDYVSRFAITPEHPPRADLWHTDLTYWPSPPSIGSLYNLVAPPVGGDTMWASSYGAYEALSPAIQRLCAELVTEHTPGPGVYDYVRVRMGEEQVQRVKEAYPPVRHPLVIRHPQTGRPALFMTSNFLDRIVGLNPSEEAALRQLLTAPYNDPNLQVRWRWQPGSMAVWDERATNHRGLSDHYPEHPYRTMRSVFVGDGIPLAELALNRS